MKRKMKSLALHAEVKASLSDVIHIKLCQGSGGRLDARVSGRAFGPHGKQTGEIKGDIHILYRADGIGILRNFMILNTHDGAVIFIQVSGIAIPNEADETLEALGSACYQTSSEKYNHLNRILTIFEESLELEKGKFHAEIYGWE